jgi:threonine dehydrogenase-like Zn-dependent dehydrogenase
VPDPSIQDSRDIIVKMMQCAICGSDLHLIHSDWTPPRHVYGIGHEAIGEIVERGSAVTTLKVGDKVMLSGAVGCGRCRSCLSGQIKRCENKATDVFGVGQGLEGCQAEAIRVPAGDFNAARIPEGISDDQAILLTDNLITAYGALIGADVCAGRSVTVIGLGPIGLMTVEMAMLMGASAVYAVDPIADRRARATTLGAIALSPNNLRETLSDMTSGRMIDSVIEAVGSTATIDLAMSVVGVNRNVSILGAGMNFEVRVPFQACLNGVTVRANMLTEISRYWPEVVPMLQSRRIKPEQFVTDYLPLADGHVAYKRAADREGGTLKVMMRPE